MIQQVYSRLYARLPVRVSTKSGEYLIRKLTVADANRYHAMTSDEGLAKWMCSEPIKDRVRVRKIVESTVEGYAGNYGSRFGICSAHNTGMLVGVCSVREASEKSADSQILEIGYYLDERYKGKGIGTQVVRELVSALAKSAGDIPTYCIARVRSDNIASRKVLEHCGFSAVLNEDTYGAESQVIILRYGIRLV